MLPYLPRCIKKCGHAATAANLEILKQEANLAYPSKSILEHAVYGKRYLRDDTAEGIRKIINMHYAKMNGGGGIDLMPASQICRFNCYLHTFPEFIQMAPKTSDGLEKVIHEIARATNLPPTIIIAMNKNILVPRTICEWVKNATDKLYPDILPRPQIREEQANSQAIQLPNNALRDEILDALFGDRFS
jgi:hypothetical protein